MTRRATGLSAAMLGTALAVAGCAKSAQPEEASDEGLELTLDEVPSDLENRLLLDFEGKAHLVGYEIDPDGTVQPGQKVTIKMYWKSVSPLTDGWKLFTHLVDDAGKQVANLDERGPLRRALPPSRWTPGKVYVDEQEIEIPKDVKSETVAITVGIWKYATRKGKDGGPAGKVDVRLDIVGGKSAGTNRGIVTRLSTGYRRPTRSPDLGKGE